ncbi:hypothetical protein V3C99_002676 [Haemonchus contortus]
MQSYGKRQPVVGGGCEHVPEVKMQRFHRSRSSSWPFLNEPMPLRSVEVHLRASRNRVSSPVPPATRTEQLPFPWR